MEYNNNTNDTGHLIDQYRYVFFYTVPILTIFCIISVIINIKVLLAVRWLRKPISPTIHMSLSLAAADAISSFLLGYSIVANILFKHANCYFATYIEMYRLSCIIITVIHLLVLSMNHWLGVLKPLHYSFMMTTRRVTIIIIFLWILPITFFNIYFFAHSKYSEFCPDFLQDFKFRMTFAAIFFISLISMVFLYVHILIIVIQHQIEWKKLSRSGSKRSRHITSNSSQQKRAMQGTIKAVCTTLLILGSCLIGWVPSLLKFILFCKNGCVYDRIPDNIGIELNLFLSHLAFFLFVLKTLANPIIYSRRMIEIQEATRRMNSELCGVFCQSNDPDINHSDTQSIPLGCSTSVRSMHRLNGLHTVQKSIRLSQRTLV
ncbi:melanocortin receptor 5-like [Onthophagus taurus]|uniref:melanocortin receptor 5-like n=1 Tax=Onthophagus taurus TaxID=166361 RepID=UPI000C1FF720|nr:histamine H2 receptor-like [Onthophagus taurus]